MHIPRGVHIPHRDMHFPAVPGSPLYIWSAYHPPHVSRYIHTHTSLRYSRASNHSDSLEAIGPRCFFFKPCIVAFDRATAFLAAPQSALSTVAALPCITEPPRACIAPPRRGQMTGPCPTAQRRAGSRRRATCAHSATCVMRPAVTARNTATSAPRHPHHPAWRPRRPLPRPCMPLRPRSPPWQRRRLRRGPRGGRSELEGSGYFRQHHRTGQPRRPPSRGTPCSQR